MTTHADAQSNFDNAVIEFDNAVAAVCTAVLKKPVSHVSVTERDNVISGTVFLEDKHRQITLSFHDTHHVNIELNGFTFTGYEPQLVVALQYASDQLDKALTYL